MSKFELKLPKMGESVAEATITSWLKEVGDTIEMDEPIVEIATDKVDSEVPSEVEGVLLERFFEVDDVVGVGQVIAVIETEGDVSVNEEVSQEEESDLPEDLPTVEKVKEKIEVPSAVSAVSADLNSPSGKFYSPLVRNIAKKEGISLQELESIQGSGKDNRVTKNDILAYLKNGKQLAPETEESGIKTPAPEPAKASTIPQSPVPPVVGDEVIEMTRMGKLISKHMVDSLRTSAHVQSFVEVDVTNIVKWRERIKDEFFKREGEKITYTPIFMEAVAKAIRDFPLMNISVDGDKVIKHKDINLGMAAALPDGNLIVPVIKKADQLNLVGMTKVVNDLAVRARGGKLNPDDIQGGTFTVTNVGSFGSIMGTPIINQPQVGILALGSIRKIPAVIETSEGDLIGIRHKMILSHSYDHRVVNGALGSMFAKRVGDYLEAWDQNAGF
ncbi:dihydrolipoamide acetyltransferase family protein [Lutimonas zeaxanthinifaciens]|uniref:dihydrolipoamide acetyltransferase family protein n=1 Tax=Lutimonas zeaxanthinifaciens TaxID=3060215 RepID=UPI00265CE58D|nr:dihydrolipoamide acetyltransferase family protein [Lutimonas sp. YSD2104]WKK65213.1 dihydrolipoamide acetyltransferase family protein [Lutimonas sp. YSD2104]